MPETKDTDWDWDDFLRRNNDELVATWGNLVNRVLSFAYKHWDGRVPDPGELRSDDSELLHKIEAGFSNVGNYLEKVRLRSALGEVMRLAAEVNKYLDETAPWFEIKNDRADAAKSIYTALQAINSLKLMFAPFLPFSSERLHIYLGYTKPLFGEQYTVLVEDSLGVHEALCYRSGEAVGSWSSELLPAGHKLLKPEPLFKKLDGEIVVEERSRLVG